MIESDDPRVHGDHVRRVPVGAGRGDLVLIGVVHDHPASEYRVEAVTEAVDPETLALELPPLAIPLFRHYAGDGRERPAFGGEMSTAISAANTGRVVGIDGPTPAFVVRVAWALRRQGGSFGTLKPVLRRLAPVTKHAVACRAAAALATATGVRVDVRAPTPHGCDRGDDPAAQAADERTQLRRAEAVANAFGVPDARRTLERTRERHMAGRLTGLGDGDDVVAVVGAAHLDPIADLVDGRQPGG